MPETENGERKESVERAEAKAEADGDKNKKAEVKAEISRIVDLMIQVEAMREQIASLKKDIKDEYAIPVATITKVATIVRKQNLSEEDEKWEEIKDWVETCS